MARSVRGKSGSTAGFFNRKRNLANQTALSGVLALGMVALASAPSFSADRDWKGLSFSGNQNFVTGSNWSGNTVPGAS